MEALFDHAPFGFALMDRDLRFVRVNQALATMNRIPAEAHIGRRSEEVVPQIADFVTPLLRRVVETNAPVSDIEVSERFTSDDGSERHWLMYYYPVPGQTGATAGIAGVVVENTGSKQARQDRMAHQRRVLESLQRSLLFEPPEDAFRNLRVGTVYDASLSDAEIGGDFFDAIPLPGGRSAFFVGDVAGKGLSAATHTAEIKFALRALLREHTDPGDALRHLNDYICDRHAFADQQVNLYVALSLVVIEPDGDSARVSVAGAEPPLLVHPDGATQTIDTGNLLLGVASGTDYPVETLPLAPGDTLLLLTDGIIEARNGAGIFGHSRVEAVASATAGLAAPRDIGRTVLDAARSYAGTLRDDACILVIRRT